MKPNKLTELDNTVKCEEQVTIEKETKAPTTPTKRSAEQGTDPTALQHTKGNQADKNETENGDANIPGNHHTRGNNREPTDNQPDPTTTNVPPEQKEEGYNAPQQQSQQP